jgi:hypothetical protein
MRPTPQLTLQINKSISPNEETMTARSKRAMSLARTSPSLRFFEDLVRFPDHNKVILKSVVTRELGPRFSSFIQYYSLQESPRCHSRSSLPILLKAVGYSLLLEDFSSVEVILVDSSPETAGSKTFCVVEMMYLLWKCRPRGETWSMP